MDKKRFQLNKDSEWWFVQDNAIQVNVYGFRDDLTGEDNYRGLKQDLTEQETVDLLNELYEDNRQLEVLLQEAEDEIYRLKKSNKQWMESLVNMESED